MDNAWQHGLYLIILGTLLCSNTETTATSDGVCGPRQLTAGSEPRHLTSPCYPGSVTHCSRIRVFIQRDFTLRCEWTITAKEGETVKVVVLEYKWNNWGGHGCKYDFLWIFDGIDPNSKILNGNCPTTRNFTTVSSSRHMRIQLSLSMARRLKMIYTGGIFAVYQHVDVYLGPSYDQRIWSPGYPLFYEGKYHLTWRISAGSRFFVIRMYAEKSHLPYKPNCSNDYLEAYDGYDSTSPSLVKWCGVEKPRKDSSGQHMFLVFHATGVTNHGVFEIQFCKIDKPKPTTTAKYPGNPQAEYGNIFTETSIILWLGIAVVVATIVIIVTCSRIYHQKPRHRSSDTVCATTTIRNSESMMPSTETESETELPPHSSVDPNQLPPSYDSLFPKMG